MDLSCWEVAFNGSEPVRAATLERFAERFAQVGFQPEVFCPCYGLAEATLLVSGQASRKLHSTINLDATALAAKRVKTLSSKDSGGYTLVSCGKGVRSSKVAITLRARKAL